MNKNNTMSTINKIKKSIQESLSYTNQDFDSILSEMVDVIQNPNLPVQWDNISETDPIMLLLVLVAAHKDILNYMTDFKLREAFMETAMKMSSVIRNAHSFGYKIPGYTTGVAKYKLVVEDDEEYTLPAFEQFFDASNTPWVFMGTNPEIDPNYIPISSENATLKNNDEIYLMQGIIEKDNIGIINPINRSKLIGLSNIAFKNAYDDSPTTYLYHKDTGQKFIQDNILQTRNTSPYLYELGLDVNEMTYLQFTNNLNLDTYGDMAAYYFFYLITYGGINIIPTDIMVLLEDNETEIKLEFTGEYYVGSDRATLDEIKEDFKKYYAGVTSLINVFDYENFILNIQKRLPNISKCLVVDAQQASNGSVPTESHVFPIEEGTVVVYATVNDDGEHRGLTSGQVEEDTNEVQELLDELTKYKISGIKNLINTNDNDPLLNLSGITLNVSLPQVQSGMIESIKEVIKDYIYDLNIGADLTAAELIRLLIERDLFKYFTGASNITFKITGRYNDNAVSRINLDINEYIETINITQGG